MNSCTTTISIRWDRVNCILRNSNITGYIVRYGRHGSESDTEDLTVTGTSGRQYTIIGLNASTVYFVMVAAMNSNGYTGPFSNQTFIEMQGKCSVCLYGGNTKHF